MRCRKPTAITEATPAQITGATTITIPAGMITGMVPRCW